MNEHGTVYGGRILELLDATASISAAKAACQQTVTVSIDQFNFIKPFKLKDSVRIISYVSGIGKRSLEIFAKIIGYHNSYGAPFLGAVSFLTFVTESTDALQLNLKPETSEEIAICQEYLTRKKINQQRIIHNNKLFAQLQIN